MLSYTAYGEGDEFVLVEGMMGAFEPESHFCMLCRNEVWRWHPEYGTVKSRAIMFWTRGMAVGAVLGFLTYGFQQWYTARHPEFYHWKDPDFPHQHADNGHGGHH